MKLTPVAHPKQALLLALCASLILPAGTSRAAEWILNNNGNWNDDGNWANPATFPNGVDAVADFSTLDITGHRTISVEQAVTLGTLQFGDTNGSHDYYLQPGAGGTLTFDVSSGSASIVRSSGRNDQIYAPITLNDNLDVTNNGPNNLYFRGLINTNGNDITFDGTGTTRFQDTGSGITGAGNVIKNGSGLLILGNGGGVPSHTYTGTTTVNGGVVMFQAANKAAGNFTLNNGMLTDYYRNTTTFSGGLGTGDNQIQIYGDSGFGGGNGNSNWRIGANNSVLQWGSTHFNPTTLKFLTTADNRGPSIYGTVTLQNGLDLNGGARTIDVLGNTSNDPTRSQATIAGVISGVGGSLIKTGAGQLVLNSTNTFTGGVAINEGSVRVGNNSGLGNGGPLSFTGAGTMLDLRASPTVSALSGTGTNGLITAGAAGARTLTVNQSTNTTFGGVIEDGLGTVTLVKAGSGTLGLDGPSTFSGGLELAGGTLAMQTATNSTSVLGAASNTVTFTGNATLRTIADGTYNLPQNITINNGVTGTIAGAFNERIYSTGVLAGSGTLIVQGLSANFDVEFRNTANTFTGPIQVISGDFATLGMASLADSAATIGLRSSGGNGGKFEYLSFANAPLVLNNRQFELITNGNANTNLSRQPSILNNAGGSNTITINTDLLVTGTGLKRFVLGGSNTGNNTFAGVIPDAIGADQLHFYKQDAGKWILSGVNTYEGDTIIDNGTLEIGGAGQLGAGNYAGNISINTGDTLIYNSSADQTLAGAITGAGSLVKDSSGTLSLTGANTYTGNTLVSQGTLLVNNSTGSATGTGNVTVLSGASLGGSGSIAGTVTSTGGTISPGNSIGTLTTGSQILGVGSTLEFEFSSDGATGSAGTEWDLLAVNGTLDLSALSSSDPLTIDLVTMANSTTTGPLASWNPAVDALWAGFVTTTGGVTGFSADAFAFNTAGFQNTLDGIFSVALNGNNLDLIYTSAAAVIPEPSRALLVVLGTLALFVRRRR